MKTRDGSVKAQDAAAHAELLDALAAEAAEEEDAAQEEEESS
jgi:hypothetical protein